MFEAKFEISRYRSVTLSIFNLKFLNLFVTQPDIPRDSQKSWSKYWIVRDALEIFLYSSSEDFRESFSIVT